MPTATGAVLALVLEPHPLCPDLGAWVLGGHVVAGDLVGIGASG